MASPVSFAIIGCGNIGKRHALHISERGLLQAVCDIDIDKATALGNEYNATVYSSIEQLLANEKQVNVVAICTPNGLHALHTIQCLQAEKHVVCEKPMAISSANCRKMIEVSIAVKKHLFIVKQNRFNAAVAQVKKALAENAFGKIFSFQLSCFWNRNSDYYKDNWHGTKLLDGGTLFTQFSHFIDVLLWLLGNVSDVQSYLQNQNHTKSIAFEDTGVAIIVLQNGAIGTLNYSVNAYRQNMEGSLTIIGEKGTVKIGGQYLNTIQYQQMENYVFTQNDEQNKANDYGGYKGSMSNHDKVYDNVLDVLHNGAAISAGAAEGLQTVELIEKIYAQNKLRL